MSDIFRPLRDPARGIYLAFQSEAAKRPERDMDEWIKAERDAVYREAAHQAQRLGLKVPSMEDVTLAESSALGHVDYGAKWAYGIAARMTP